MVGHGPETPDPPDNSPEELIPPSRADLLMHGPQAEDSDEEQHENFGYEPLPQGPEAVNSDHESDDDENIVNWCGPFNDVPAVEPMEAVLTREVWNSPRPTDSIQINSETAFQVTSAMANFVLPPTAIPEWARAMSDEEWKCTLKAILKNMKGDND